MAASNSAEPGRGKALNAGGCMTQERVLIVEDEENERSGLAELVTAWGYRAETARNGLEGLEKVQAGSPFVVLTDLSMPRMDGLELIERLQGLPNGPKVILITGKGDLQTEVSAVQSGAYWYIEKPLNPKLLRALLEKVSHLHRTETDKELLRRELRDKGALGTMVGGSPRMQEVFHLMELVAPSTAPVLITGESGTGKELVARTIHDLSPRRNKPFIAINCAAIPETLIESEIFGHEKGAFTGALERRVGCFELAEGGTLLLDEIGEMPIGTQAKLLRVLEDHHLRRLGSKTETAVDVRVLAATNKVPEEAVAKGQLRNDLYYRLNVFALDLPPLREHKEDIDELAKELTRGMCAKHGRKLLDISTAVLEAFQQYAWPGNVRELRNVLERAVIVCDGAAIELRHLPPGFGHTSMLSPAQDANAVHVGVGTTVEEAEKLLILKTLESTGNNKTRAAEILGISLKTLHNKLKEYGRDNLTAEAAP